MRKVKRKLHIFSSDPTVFNNTKRKAFVVGAIGGSDGEDKTILSLVSRHPQYRGLTKTYPSNHGDICEFYVTTSRESEQLLGLNMPNGQMVRNVDTLFVSASKFESRHLPSQIDEIPNLLLMMSCNVVIILLENCNGMPQIDINILRLLDNLIGFKKRYGSMFFKGQSVTICFAHILKMDNLEMKLSEKEKESTRQALSKRLRYMISEHFGGSCSKLKHFFRIPDNKDLVHIIEPHNLSFHDSSFTEMEMKSLIDAEHSMFNNDIDFLSEYTTLFEPHESITCENKHIDMRKFLSRQLIFNSKKTEKGQTYFKLPTMSQWMKIFRKVVAKFTTGIQRNCNKKDVSSGKHTNSSKKSFQIMFQGEETSCNILLTYFANLCTHALEQSISVYATHAPDLYPERTHVSLLKLAFKKLSACISTGTVNTEHLESELRRRCEELWSIEKRQCNSLSFLGKMCSHPFHFLREGSSSTHVQEICEDIPENVDRSRIPFLCHCNKEIITEVCACGYSTISKEHSFTLQDANDLYVQNCCSQATSLLDLDIETRKGSGWNVLKMSPDLSYDQSKGFNLFGFQKSYNHLHKLNFNYKHLQFAQKLSIKKNMTIKESGQPHKLGEKHTQHKKDGDVLFSVSLGIEYACYKGHRYISSQTTSDQHNDIELFSKCSKDGKCSYGWPNRIQPLMEFCKLCKAEGFEVSRKSIAKITYIHVCGPEPANISCDLSIRFNPIICHIPTKSVKEKEYASCEYLFEDKSKILCSEIQKRAQEKVSHLELDESGNYRLRFPAAFEVYVNDEIAPREWIFQHQRNVFLDANVVSFSID